MTTARELSVAEIGTLCATGVPIEVFCHGAICIGYSGACGFSALRRGALRCAATARTVPLSYDLVDEAGQSVVAVEGIACFVRGLSGYRASARACCRRRGIAQDRGPHEESRLRL
ncbi:MAG: U32 family peptidase [Collinsella sp.]